MVAASCSVFRTNLFSSLDNFKTWVFKQTTIAVQDQISLTGQGKPARFQALLTEVGGISLAT